MGKINLSMTAVRLILMNSSVKGKRNKSLEQVCWSRNCSHLLLLSQEDARLIKEIEEACSKFDTNNSGLLSEMEVLSVLSYVDISCQHDKANLNKYSTHMPCVISLLQIVSICSNLPRNRSGKMRIEEFLNMPILSEEAFNALDRLAVGCLVIMKIFSDQEQRWVYHEGWAEARQQGRHHGWGSAGESHISSPWGCGDMSLYF